MRTYTEGVFVLTARHSQWCVRIGDRLFASHSIKNLKKKIHDPDAKIGCMVEIRYIEQKSINSSKKRTLRGHIDFNTGEFSIKGNAKGRENPVEYQAEEPDEIMEEVAAVATAHMLKKWQNKFRKEAKL